MTRFLLDADIVIYALTARYPNMRARFEACAPGELALSAVSLAEISVGTSRGKPPKPEILNAFLALCPVLPFDEAAARAYAALPFKRARFDRLLAAHALSIGAVVVTNNEADFTEIAGLELENWTL